MTITNEVSNVVYTSDGALLDHPIPFYFKQDSHIQVNDVETTTNTPTPLVISTDYTLTGAGNPVGGELNLVAPIAAGHLISINRWVPLTQLIDYISGDAFPAELHESGADKITMILQQIKALADRCSTLAIWDNSGPPDISLVRVVSSIFPARTLDAADGNSTYAWEQVQPVSSSSSWQTLSGGLSSSTEGRAMSYNECLTIPVGSIVEMMGLTNSLGSTVYRFKNPGVCN